MADLYGTNARSPSLESEDMSSLLHNLLHSSSTSQPPSSASFKEKHKQFFSSPAPAPTLAGTSDSTSTANLSSRLPIFFYSDCRFGEGTSTAGSSVIVDSSTGFNFSDPGLGFMADAEDCTRNTFSSACAVDSDGITSTLKGEFTAEKDGDDLGFDSKKGNEVSEAPVNPVPSRSSKRSRAAEVHNLSEKRRRSRINEKMKALQNLIPNSNKTDKASMLDEAIEYLKHLQLQVQNSFTILDSKHVVTLELVGEIASCLMYINYQEKKMGERRGKCNATNLPEFWITNGIHVASNIISKKAEFVRDSWYISVIHFRRYLLLVPIYQSHNIEDWEARRITAILPQPSVHITERHHTNAFPLGPRYYFVEEKQMLSMRNGSSLHPFCLPGSLPPAQLPQLAIGFDGGSELLNSKGGEDTFSRNQAILMRAAFELPNQCMLSNQPNFMSPVTNITNSETSLGLDPLIQNHYEPFNHLTTSKVNSHEDKSSQLQLDMSCSRKKSSSGVPS